MMECLKTRFKKFLMQNLKNNLKIVEYGMNID